MNCCEFDPITNIDIVCQEHWQQGHESYVEYIERLHTDIKAGRDHWSRDN